MRKPTRFEGFQWNTAKLQMLQPDWLSDRTLPAISVQWLSVLCKMATFACCFFFHTEALEERFDATR